MKINAIAKVRGAVRRIEKRFASRGVILMYHRVAEAGSDPWSLCVTPRHFAEHLEVLQKYGYPMRLQQLASSLREGNIPPRALCVTFDDGYADNLHNAKPLLERYNIPATVFLTSGYIGHPREFWWDELDRLLLQPGTLPKTLCLSINGSTYQWELGEAAYYSEDEYQSDRDRRPWEGTPGSRLFFYYSLWQQLRPLSASDRQNVLDEIVTWASAEPVARSTHRTLLPEEVHVLAQGELIEVGAHTVTHPFLPAHSLAFQRDEILRSKADLENVLGRTVASFAYPFGDYTPQTVTLTREAGFTCACSTVADTVWQQSDCFELPRFEVQNWNGEEFRQRLSKWFRG